MAIVPSALNEQSFKLNLNHGCCVSTQEKGFTSIGVGIRHRFVVEIHINFIGAAKIGLQKGATPFAIGFSTTSVLKIYKMGKACLTFHGALDCLLASTLSGLSLCVPVAIKEGRDAYNEKYSRTFYIDDDQRKKFIQSLEKTKGIVGEFLSHKPFIEENFADGLTDAITFEPIIDPYVTPCNHCFDSTRIKEQVMNKKECPMDRAPINSVNDLKFSWDTHWKMLKVVREMMNLINKNDDQLLPPKLRGKHELRNQINDLDECSKAYMVAFASELRAALEDAKKLMTELQYHENLTALTNWTGNL